jgi:hypothetical protein
MTIEGATFLLPTEILRQDAVVIDKQENHLVMTLRVSLDLIRDNHTTLMALIEIATGKRGRRSSWKRAMATPHCENRYLF